MKKFLFSVITVLFCTIAMAHTVTPQCWNKGRFTLFVASVHNNMSVKVTVNSWDTTINITGTSFTFSVPQATLNNPVHVKFSFSDGFKTDVWTTSVKCLNLPLKYKKFDAIYLGNREFLVTFILFEVTNVRQIDIMASLDGGHTYKPYGYVLPDNLYLDKKYTIKVKL